MTDSVSPDSLFSLAGVLAAGGWILLAALPRWRWTMGIAAVFLPLTLAGLYLGLVGVHVRATMRGAVSAVEISEEG